MGNATGIEWSAEQVCGECGEGVFARDNGNMAICVVCGHEHPMDPVNLDEREAFEWRLSPTRPYYTLHVTCYAPSDSDA